MKPRWNHNQYIIWPFFPQKGSRVTFKWHIFNQDLYNDQIKWELNHHLILGANGMLLIVFVVWKSVLVGSLLFRLDVMKEMPWNSSTKVINRQIFLSVVFFLSSRKHTAEPGWIKEHYELFLFKEMCTGKSCLTKNKLKAGTTLCVPEGQFSHKGTIHPKNVTLMSL